MKMSIAIGVLSGFGKRRILLRTSEWFKTLQSKFFLKFIVRAENIRHIDRAYNDTVVFDLPNIANRRLTLLYSWMKYALSLLSIWIVKTDDDVVLSYSALLAVQSVFPQNALYTSIYMGNLQWHAYERSSFKPKNFGWVYDDTEWTRGIRYLNGHRKAAISQWGNISHVLDNCKKECAWCNRSHDCIPSFAFSTGWFIAMSRHLIESVIYHPICTNSINRSYTINQPEILEDIWLGSIIRDIGVKRVIYADYSAPHNVQNKVGQPHTTVLHHPRKTFELNSSTVQSMYLLCGKQQCRQRNACELMTRLKSTWCVSKHVMKV